MAQTRILQLAPLHEYRFELEGAEEISVVLLSGTAECFGFELTKGQPHPFGSQVRAAIWTPSGAELEMSLIVLYSCTVILILLILHYRKSGNRLYCF